jgi:hypothetical protein
MATGASMPPTGDQDPCFPSGIVTRDQNIRRAPLLNPCFERPADIMPGVVGEGRRVDRLSEAGWTKASLAMDHAGHHEQPVEARNRSTTTSLARNGSIPVDAAAGSDDRIGPAEVGNNLAAARPEFDETLGGKVERRAGIRQASFRRSPKGQLRWRRGRSENPALR